MDNNFAMRAASRSRWIDELSVALEEAQPLLSELAAQRISQADADRLRERIDQLRVELRALHRRRFTPGHSVKWPRLLHPDWRPRRD